jgi:hypothetical protein
MRGRPMKLHAIFCAFLFITIGCSGGDEPDEAVKADKTDDSAELEKKEKTEVEPDAEEVAGAEEAPVEEVGVTPAPVAATPAPTAEPAGFEGPKVWKYVTSFALNVRGAPDKVNSTVIRHVKWGDKVEVVINGEWAKLAAGEYISAKFLSDTDPALKNAKASKRKGK